MLSAFRSPHSHKRSIMAPYFSFNCLAAEAPCAVHFSSYFQTPSSLVGIHVTSSTLPAVRHWNPHSSFAFDRTISAIRVHSRHQRGRRGSGLRLVLQRPCVSFLSSQPDVSIKCVACTGMDEDCNPSQQYMSFFYYLKLWTFSIFFSACLVLSIMIIVLRGDDVLQF